MQRISDYKKLATDITNWIRDYAINAGLPNLVVGVSGGVDSALVSTLCAMTGLETHCYTIGIEHVPTLAIDHNNWLMANYNNVCATTVQWGRKDIEHLFYAGTELAWANTQSRLRMTYLYHYASIYKGIVVGTGNKVEDFGIGFFTKYGDGGVDISPIADLYKSEVREMARVLGVSEDICSAIPTDGLWADGRTDEEQLSCTYDELESVMEGTCTDQRVIDIYNTLYQKGLHKVLPIPVYKL